MGGEEATCGLHGVVIVVVVIIIVCCIVCCGVGEGVTEGGCGGSVGVMGGAGGVRRDNVVEAAGVGELLWE